VPKRATQRTAPWWPICGARPPPAARPSRIASHPGPDTGAKQAHIRHWRRGTATTAYDCKRGPAPAAGPDQRGDRRREREAPAPAGRPTPHATDTASHRIASKASPCRVPILRRGCAGSTRAHVGWAGSVTWSVSRHRRAARLPALRGGDRKECRLARELTRVALSTSQRTGMIRMGRGTNVRASSCCKSKYNAINRLNTKVNKR